MGDVKLTDLKMARHEIARHPVSAFSVSIQVPSALNPSPVLVHGSIEIINFKTGARLQPYLIQNIGNQPNFSHIFNLSR